jgi:hypothetical protein
VTRRTAYLLAAATVVAGALVLSGVTALMVIGGLPLGLLLPGLALTALLFGRPGHLLAIERIMLVPALSLGTLILGGLLAWLVRAPLHRLTWLAVSGTVTLAGLLLCAAKAPAAPAAGPSGVRGGRSHLPVFQDRFEPERLTTRGRLLKQALPAVLAVAMLAGAAWLSVGTSLQTHRVTVTTLSVVPPGAADSTGTRAVQVNATGLATGTAYTLQVTSPSASSASSASFTNTSTALTADENGLWTSTLHLPGDERLTLALYRAGDSVPMRTVIIASAATG